MLASSVLEYDYASAADVRCDVADLLKPRRRISVSKAAEELVHIELPGGYSGPWSPRITPYMARPMDMLSSRRHEAEVFVGPARTGKTQGLLDCWIAHTIEYDPGDMMVVHMSQDMAQDYSQRRVDRLNRTSPVLRERIRLGTHDDNVFRKVYRNGMILTIAWPTTTQLAARDQRFVAFTDYDGMPQQIGHEGTPFALGQKRTQTFMSGGMTLVESSPRHEWPDPDWRPSTPHELPSATGVCSLYNRGTREVWYFQCEHCGEWYIPDFPEAFAWDGPRETSDDGYAASLTNDQIEAAAASTRYVCEHCGVLEELARKQAMNLAGRWVADGCRLDQNGQVLGEPPKSTVVSFRLPAGAAAFQRGSELTRRFLTALREFERTGDESGLRSTTTLDCGRPYRSMVSQHRRDAEDLMDRAEASERGQVPTGVRFLTATVDVQAKHFAVLITGWGVDLERWIVDRYDLRSSRRRVDDAYDWVDPASHDEDWDLLIDEVIARTYPLSDGTGRRMCIKAMAVDSGGAAGVTDRAYSFQRRMRAKGFGHRVYLVKGEGRKGAPRARLTHPEDDLNLYILNANVLKDGLANDLERQQPGPGYTHTSTWLPEGVFTELTAEARDPRKGWVNPGGRRNETWDLLVYARALAIILGAEQIKWNDPVAWAREWDTNTLVIGAPDDGGTTPIDRVRKPRHGRRPRILNRGFS